MNTTRPPGQSVSNAAPETPAMDDEIRARFDSQDERITMIQDHMLEHHADIKRAIDTAVQASRAATAALELVQRVLTKEKP